MAEAGGHAIRTELLVSGYRGRAILHGVSIQILPGEIVALIGHNGSGKSTLLKTIFGMVALWQGRIFVDEIEMKRPSPVQMLRAGVAYVPQGNRVFGDLTVRENLEVGAVSLDRGMDVRTRINRVLDTFPALATRLQQRAASLSGGEKQMLALASALLLSPRVLLLDEPSLGLATPATVQALRHIRELSQIAGISVLVVEQKVRAVIEISARVYVLRNGAVHFTGKSELLHDENRLREVYL